MKRHDDVDSRAALCNFFTVTHQRLLHQRALRLQVVRSSCQVLLYCRDLVNLTRYSQDPDGQHIRPGTGLFFSFSSPDDGNA
ncbi:hypothetical protein M404DRAFT_1002301 [Pisolithus tinctorius Marx 270]|uniref:Uncharacterized protein n=1 Tax=Pisolithus tinctorius Marx 270 TaxID=870435 RepID=A0A0C3IZN8_PISTI|nr:hypothetical protein M404DRAFT_1002301 [Pisolithus tinctorius Marx 270]